MSTTEIRNGRRNASQAELSASSVRQSRQRAHSLLQKRFKKFRLQTASVILGNHSYTLGILNDEQRTAHTFELCDQYCLSIFLNWIATKHGFPIYSSAIKTYAGDPLLPLQSWDVVAWMYPLNLPDFLANDKTSASPLIAMLEEEFEPRWDMLGELYQNIISAPLVLNNNNQIDIQKSAKGRQGGEFYTPFDVVEYCLNRLIDEDSAGLMNRIKQSLRYAENSERHIQNNVAQFKIIDPACGSGNFLLGSLDWLLKRLADDRAITGLQPGVTEHEPDSGTASDESNAYLRRILIEEVLHGRDVDARAVDLCRLSLIASCGRRLHLTRHQHDLETCKAELMSLSTRVCSNIKTEDAVLSVATGTADRGTFDLVIGNPPYISFGSRDQPKISPQWQKFLRWSYPNSTEYKIRLYSVFQEISVMLAKPGALICLLVPDAYLNGSYYQKLRKLILRDCEIQSLTEMPRDSVPGAVVGNWCVPCYRKKVSPTAMDNSMDGKSVLVKLHRVEDDGATTSFALPEQLFVSKDKNRFQLIFSEQDAELIRITRDLSPLSTQLTGHTGIRARYGQASIIASVKAAASYKPGITSGGSVRSHRPVIADAWLDITPSKLFAGGFSPEVIEPAKLLMRQTADRIIATVDQNGLYHLNNVHSFAPAVPQMSLQQLLYFCGLLNSKLYLHLYRMKTREQGRALAQIDIEMVESMPVPIADDAAISAIASTCLGLLSVEDESERLKQTALVDQWIYELFKLPQEVIRHVESNPFTAGITG